MPPTREIVGNLPARPGIRRDEDVAPDDASLIHRTLAGETAAYGELVRRYQNRLYNTVFRLVGSAEDARDIVQDSFISAFEALNRFHGDSQFFTWLYRIAVNASISHKRKQRRTLRSGQGGSAGIAPEPADLSDGHAPDAALQRSEDRRSVQEALMRLGSEFRAVLVLREIDGRKYEEIAELLNLPIGTVRSRIHRARLELRLILEGMSKPKLDRNR
jgi:RNA polymerase sigma-70 factor (ECF subfamily)